MFQLSSQRPVTPGFRRLRTATHAATLSPTEHTPRVPLGASGGSDAAPEGERYGEQDQRRQGLQQGRGVQLRVRQYLIRINTKYHNT
jgi:hypothetical protein